MGTQVLRPHDCLRHSPAFITRQRDTSHSLPGHHRRRREASLKPLHVELKTKEAEEAVAAYAGTAFALSPAPSAVPLPRFFSKKDESLVVDYLATRDLRRLLRLD